MTHGDMKKKEKLEAIGCDVEILWETSLIEKGISGSDVRKLITSGKEWKRYVPEYVHDYVLFNHLDEKLRM